MVVLHHFQWSVIVRMYRNIVGFIPEFRVVCFSSLIDHSLVLRRGNWVTTMAIFKVFFIGDKNLYGPVIRYRMLDCTICSSFSFAVFASVAGRRIGTKYSSLNTGR